MDGLAQIASCPFCRENYRRIGSHERTLSEPTEEFPIWTPEIEAAEAES
ncbi:MAG TPA: hypothetical protein VFI54_06390 [Solirubrobacteraceae bacterium]|nr:hypothetical protein [Solirubrobacteraceae bacterium]